jgi:SAM-dependent methyltransferase
MDHIEVGKYWDADAEAWTALARQGYDRSRDLFNTPTFLGMLPDVTGLAGLDIGCGEGHNTRLLAGRGARMTGIDIAATFIRHAREAEGDEPLGIEYLKASAVALPFEHASFAFATAFMSLQDIPQQHVALAEAHRVLRPGGFLQFSITQPCFQTPKWEWIRDESGRRIALVVGDYFRDGEVRIDAWTFSAAPQELRDQYPPFKVPYFDRTLSDWLNLLLRAGFQMEVFAEPTPDDEALRQHPPLYDARIIAYFLIVRCRKP